MTVHIPIRHARRPVMHQPIAVQSTTRGWWNIVCEECSIAAQDYTYPCLVHPNDETRWPPSVLFDASVRDIGDDRTDRLAELLEDARRWAVFLEQENAELEAQNSAVVAMIRADRWGGHDGRGPIVGCPCRGCAALRALGAEPAPARPQAPEIPRSRWVLRNMAKRAAPASAPADPLGGAS